MRKLFLLAFIFPFITHAQYREPAGGGSFTPGKGICITPAEKARMLNIANANAEAINKKNKPTGGLHHKSTGVTYEWPLAQDTNFHYYCIYGVGNFVDHDTVFPGALLDYNCGARTYDLTNGYNHEGTDIFLWPFDFNMMDDERGRIVAAAPGTIIYKLDTEIDTNCIVSSAISNAVIVMHSDGYRTWYLHMKKYSLTTKNVGDTVAVGEFLGLVGSSGSSLGPHLHFEVHDPNNIVVDPFIGPCNSGTSLWTNQRAYREPGINTLMTHYMPPSFQPCPQLDSINNRDTFLPGSTIYFAPYYHDQLTGLMTNYSIIRPNNSVYSTWSHFGDTIDHDASYWYWIYTIPASELQGAWKFRAVYEGETYEHTFYILDPLNVANTEAEKERVYPNPAGNTIYFSGTQAGKVVISDVLGKAVLANDNFAGEQLDISALNTGMYFVKIINGDKISTYKISVQK